VRLVEVQQSIVADAENASFVQARHFNVQPSMLQRRVELLEDDPDREEVMSDLIL
jgi:hypothetical protein